MLIPLIDMGIYNLSHSVLLILRVFLHLLEQIIVMNCANFVFVFTFFSHIKLMTLEELGIGPPQGADLSTFDFKSVVHNDDKNDDFIGATNYTAQIHRVTTDLREAPAVKGHLQVSLETSVPCWTSFRVLGLPGILVCILFHLHCICWREL